MGFIEINALRKVGARNTVYSRHQCTKAGKQPRATQEATGCVVGCCRLSSNVTTKANSKEEEEEDVVRCHIEATFKHS